MCNNNKTNSIPQAWEALGNLGMLENSLTIAISHFKEAWNLLNLAGAEAAVGVGGKLAAALIKEKENIVHLSKKNR